MTLAIKSLDLFELICDYPYVVPEVRIVEVCQENLMNNPTSWDDGSGNRKPIVEGNPGEGSDNYAKWHGFNVWEDDIKY